MRLDDFQGAVELSYQIDNFIPYLGFLIAQSRGQETISVPGDSFYNYDGDIMLDQVTGFLPWNQLYTAPTHQFQFGNSNQGGGSLYRKRDGTLLTGIWPIQTKPAKGHRNGPLFLSLRSTTGPTVERQKRMHHGYFY
jgi:hypothetical protein